jgi:large subunit ribosomal protein L9
MKVILMEPQDNLGHPGEVVNVKPGYARNYLIPRGIAVLATAANLNSLEAQTRARSRRAAEQKASAERLAQVLEAVSLEIPVRSGETKIYGSVGARDLAEQLELRHQIKIDSRKLELPRPLKELGEYEIPYRPHPEVPITLRVKLVPEAANS